MRLGNTAALHTFALGQSGLINYSDMLSKVESLRQKLGQVERKAEESRWQVKHENARIQRYKGKYAQLIRLRPAGTIKSLEDERPGCEYHRALPTAAAREAVAAGCC